MNEIEFIHFRNQRSYVAGVMDVPDKKTEILRCGKALFTQKGYKDTNVAEIMNMAGYATGSFYRYFPSKDHLFMELFNQENVTLKHRIIQAVDMQAEPMAVMETMMMQNLAGMKENPILSEWYNHDIFAKIERNFRESNAIDHVEFFFQGFADVIRHWQKEGRMRNDMHPDMILAIFSALINIDLHKEEIGMQYFPEIMEHLGLFIMQGLAPDAAGGHTGKSDAAHP